MISNVYPKMYCCEGIQLIENYQEAVSSQEQYECHHRLEIQNGMEVSTKELIKDGLYWNRPASELIFLSRKEHKSLHLSIRRKGHPLSDEQKQFLSNYWKGKKKEKHTPMSDEQKQKLSKLYKGKGWNTNKGKKKVWNDDTYTKFHYE